MWIRDPWGRNGVREVELGADVRAGVTDDAVLHISAYHDLVTVVIKDASGVSNDGMARLARLPHLTNLFVNDAPQITDEGLRRLGSSTKLLNVRLSNCPGVTGTGAPSHLKNGHVDHEAKRVGLLDFALSDGKATPEGLRALGADPPRHLSLVRMQIRDADLAHFREGTRLTSLALRDNAIEGPGLANLSKLSGLQVLDLSGNPLNVADSTGLQVSGS